MGCFQCGFDCDLIMAEREREREKEKKKSKEKKPLVKMAKERPITVAFYKWQQHLVLLAPSLRLLLYICMKEDEGEDEKEEEGEERITQREVVTMGKVHYSIHRKSSNARNM